MTEAVNFTGDILSSKSNGEPVTLASLEETRQGYLDAHPEVQVPLVSTQTGLRTPPTDPMELSDHIVGRF